jgi:hypothetical protein
VGYAFDCQRVLAMMMKFPFCGFENILLSLGVVVMLRFLSHAPVFLAFPLPPPLRLLALNQPCRLAAAADALSGMDDTDLLLIFTLPHKCKRQENSQKIGQMPHIVTMYWPSKTQSNYESAKLMPPSLSRPTGSRSLRCCTPAVPIAPSTLRWAWFLI